MAQMSGLRIKGVEQMRVNLGQLGRRMPGAAKKFLTKEGIKVKNTALPLTPLSTGGAGLRGSALVGLPISTTKGVSVLVSFGGSSAPYAEAQHAGPGSRVAPPSWDGLTELNYQEPGTGKKFLTKALIERGKGFPDRATKMFTKAMEDALKRTSKSLKKR